MRYAQHGDHYILRLDEGEEVLAALRRFFGAQEIRAGYFLAADALASWSEDSVPHFAAAKPE